MNARRKTWMLAAIVLALICAGVAGAAIASSAQHSWDTRHGVILQRAVDGFWTAHLTSSGSGTDRLISADSLHTLITDADATNDPLIVDLRVKGDYDAGHIQGAVQVTDGGTVYDFKTILKPQALAKLEEMIDSHVGNKSVVIYCQSGHKGAFLTGYLGVLGFDVQDLSGGWSGWTWK